MDCWISQTSLPATAHRYEKRWDLVDSQPAFSFQTFAGNMAIEIGDIFPFNMDKQW